MSARASLRRTAGALGLVATRRDGRAVAALVGVGYLLVYLVTVGDLAPAGGPPTWGIVVVSDPLAVAVQPRGPATFEPVARVDLGPLTYLFAPLDVVLGAALSTLVGLNLALSYLTWRQPAACGLEAGSGLVAAVPALLSGTACCGPAVLIVVGVQAGAVLLAAFEVLVPSAVLLLLASLVLVGRTVEPGRTEAAE